MMEMSPYGMIKIEVEDTGIGIKKEHQHKLFKLFGFIDATRELNTSGVGLGLHISKQIVKQFGGDIFVRSKWNQGTIFTFLISLDKKQEIENNNFRCLNPLKKVYPKIEISSKKLPRLKRDSSRRGKLHDKQKPLR